MTVGRELHKSNWMNMSVERLDSRMRPAGKNFPLFSVGITLRMLDKAMLKEVLDKATELGADSLEPKPVENVRVAEEEANI